jgi:hypothetical protein
MGVAGGVTNGVLARQVAIDPNDGVDLWAASENGTRLKQGAVHMERPDAEKTQA